MIHQKQIFENGESVIHFPGAHQSDYSLCGQDLAGDSLDERGNYEQSEYTKEKVNCKDCIKIVEHCKSILKSEYIKLTQNK